MGHTALLFLVGINFGDSLPSVYLLSLLSIYDLSISIYCLSLLIIYLSISTVSRSILYIYLTIYYLYYLSISTYLSVIVSERVRVRPTVGVVTTVHPDLLRDTTRIGHVTSRDS